VEEVDALASAGARAGRARQISRRGARPSPGGAAAHFSSSSPSPPTTQNKQVRAAAGKTLWYPGATAPAHLDASAPGYAGFDPLNLGANSPEVLSYFTEAERVHGRWAMAAMAGILASPSDWWTAGAKPTPIPLPTLLAVEVAFMAFVEAKRYEGWQKRTDKFFDPAGMDSPEMRVKEIKNGRLAMLAVLGCASVHAVRGLTPLEALKSHISSPWTENIYTSSVGTEFAVAVALGATIPMVIEARKTLDPKADKGPFKSAIPF
jgi:hypothetical protein